MLSANFIVWSLVACAAAATAVGFVALRMAVRRTGLTTARLPLFAVRDELVRMAIDGEMQENDPAWRQIYLSVNALLSLHPRLNIYYVARQQIRHAIAVARNPEAQARQRKLDDLIERAIASNPAFAAVVKQFDDAYIALVGKRSTLWHLAACVAYLWLLRGVFFGRDIWRQMRRPGTSDLAGCLVEEREAALCAS